MEDATDTVDDLRFQRNMMTSFIQIAALVVLVTFSIQIIGPFTSIVIWGIVLSVALYPLHLKLAAALGGNARLSSVAITLIGLAVVIGPAWVTSLSVVDSVSSFVSEVRAGTARVPTPSEDVAEWPLIGEQLYEIWSGAAADLADTLARFQPQISQVAERMMRTVAGLALGVLQFAVSIIIAGVCLMFGKEGYALTASITRRISAARGKIWADLSISTIRSVTNGVLGVAAIQGILAGIGFFAIGVPHPGLFAGLILVTAIIQLPALLFMLPIAIWTFSFADTLPATVFTVYSILVALSDNFLKPLLLGRGVDLPALIVLIGAIGGMIRFGVIGLFLGAVILGLSYTIVSDWLRHPGGSATDAGSAANPTT